jgi:H+/Cl- antiporter ClcA
VRSFRDPIYKIIFTALTLGCGFQGGELTPLLFTGASLGSALSPFLNLPISFLASLGAVSLFAGCTNTPLTAFLMGIELYGGHNASYLFLVCVITYLFSGNKGIYTSQRLIMQKAKLFQDDDPE